MNAVLSRRVSLIAAHGLPSIPSPTIGGATGDLPIASGSVPPRQASSFPSRLAHVHRPNRVHLVPVSRDLVTDWSFSFRCSPPRLAATQLRSDTPRLFAAEKRTLTVLSTRHLRRTRAVAAAQPISIPFPPSCENPKCKNPRSTKAPISKFQVPRTNFLTAEGLILRGRRHMLSTGQMIQKQHNFRCRHLPRIRPSAISISMESEEPGDPLKVRNAPCFTRRTRAPGRSLKEHALR